MYTACILPSISCKINFSKMCLLSRVSDRNFACVSHLSHALNMTLQERELNIRDAYRDVTVFVLHRIFKVFDAILLDSVTGFGT
jgi:hypothetical protein